MERSCNVSTVRTLRCRLPCPVSLAALALCLGVSAGCHSPAGMEHAQPGRLTCPRKLELLPEIAAAGATTVFGEIHGTREAPEFFGDVVCNAALGSQHVLVGLELPSSETGAVQAFLAGNDQLAGREFWTQPFQSGRTSAAMLAMLSELRRIIQSNPRVELFLFDIPQGVDPQGRDARMADAILRTRASDREAVVLLLVGNLHARKTKGVPWDSDLEPMAYHLVTRGLRVISLNLRNPKGTAWICSSNDAASCGPAGMGGEEPSPGASPRGIRLDGATSPEGYDGVYIVSSMTASPPAMPVRR